MLVQINDSKLAIGEKCSAYSGGNQKHGHQDNEKFAVNTSGTGAFAMSISNDRSGKNEDKYQQP